MTEERDCEASPFARHANANLVTVLLWSALVLVIVLDAWGRTVQSANYLEAALIAGILGDAALFGKQVMQRAKRSDPPDH